MTHAAERAVKKFLWRAIAAARDRHTPLVLLGSYSRGTAIQGVSDIDLLLVDGDRAERVPESVHLIRLTRQQLEERVGQGDDFAQWALRYGRPITCRQDWAGLAERLLRDAPWPSVHRKLEQLKKRLTLAEDLLEMGDIEAAQEETGSALNLLARAMLLSSERFPLSGPELSSQLRSIGEHDLARQLDRLRSPLGSDGTVLSAVLTEVRQKVAKLNNDARTSRT